MREIKITAHSGAEDTKDNSLEFVRYALTLDIDCLEVDVRRRDDGTLALGHDEADENSPLLSQAFDIIKEHKSMMVNCDCKIPDLELDILKLAKEKGLLGRIIFSGSVNPKLYYENNELKENTEVYLNIEDCIENIYINYRNIPDFEIEAAKTICEICKKYEISVVNMFHMLVTRRFVEMLKKEGIGLSVWTVDEPEDIQWFYEQGVHNITTRKPTLCK